MTIIAKSPEDYRECKLYRHLLDTSTPADGCAERVCVFVNTVAPLLDLTMAGPFKEYTLHNHNHAKKLLHLAEYIIPPDTLDSISPLECQAFIYSAFLHDLGMSLSSEERKRILATPEYTEEFKEWTALWNALLQARKRLEDLSMTHPDEIAREAERLTIETEVFQLQEAALATYLRPRHATAERYAQLAELVKRNSGRSDIFESSGVSFEKWLIDINVSHNQDVGALAEIYGPNQERFPRDLSIGGQKLNTQFIAALLRMTDILDFDNERTPRILFESLGIASRSLPGSDVSLKEWQKHMAIHDIDISTDELVISADCQHPAIEKTVRDFCQVIEREIRDTLAVLRHNAPKIADQYKFSLPFSVRPRITAEGYVYTDMSLQLSQAAITSLLMGERLYLEPAVCLRELIQNSIDACAARIKLVPDPTYVPEISVNVREDDGRRLWIEVKDNGMGMDEHILSEYFLKVGNCYYSSPEFERICRKLGLTEPFTAIARFGIGLVSSFIIGDAIEVTTSHICSPRNDDVPRFVRIERMGGLAFVAKASTDEQGTRVGIRLQPEIQANYGLFALHAMAYLKNIIPRPAFDIRVKLTEDAFILKQSNQMTFKSTGRAFLAEKHIEPIIIDLQRWSNLAGTLVLLFGIGTDGRLSHRVKGKKIVINERYGIDPGGFLDGYAGNRITVNGFKMSLSKKPLKIFKVGKDKIGAVIDIGVTGDSNVDYDVSRTKIIGVGQEYIRDSIRSATLKCLSETQILDRFDEETRSMILRITKSETPTSGTHRRYLPQIDSRFLDEVANKLPKDTWPKGIHKEIAKQLGVTNSAVWEAIDILITTKKVTKPPSNDPS